MSGTVCLSVAALTWLVGEIRPGQLVVQFLFVSPFILIFLMSLRIAVTVDKDMLQVRSYWRTRRFLVRDVVAVEVEPYAGYWVGYSSFGWPYPRMLTVLRADGRLVDLPATLGFGKRIRALADQLNDILAAPPEDEPLVFRDVVSERALRRDIRKRRRGRGRM